MLRTDTLLAPCFLSPILWIKLTRTILYPFHRIVPKRTTNKKRTYICIYINITICKKVILKKKTGGLPLLTWKKTWHATSDWISMARSSTLSRYTCYPSWEMLCYVLGGVGGDRATSQIPRWTISPKAFRRGAARISPSCGATDSARSAATQHWESAYVLEAGRSSGGPRC